MKRRNFLRQIGGVLLAGSVARSVRASGESLKSAPDVVLYRGDYPGWPWIIRTRGGSFLCVFREGTEHGFSAAGKALLVRSDDGGRTWTKPSTIVDQPGVDDRNVAIAELAPDQLLVVYNTYDAAGVSLAMTVRSVDGGKTWQSPETVGTPNTRTRSAPMRLSGGELLLPYYVAPGNGALAARSSDEGHTWTTTGIPDTQGFVGDEWDVLEVEPGRLIGIFRNSHRDSDGTLWKSESKDGGRSWSTPQPTNVRCLRCPAPPQLVLQSNRPTLIYADRRMVSVSAVTTRDPQFLNWDLNRRIECFRYRSDESAIPDGSYPASAPIDAKTRLIVDYEIREEGHQISGYFVAFPDDWGSE